MNIDDFIAKIEVEFDEVSPGTLIPSTDFRNLDEWSSMHAIIIMALMDVEYGVVLKGEDLMQVTTIQALFDLVKSRKE